MFSHEAHLRLAWINITKYGHQQAEVNVREQLYRYVCSQGAKDKFNLTLTLAAVKAVHHFVKRSHVNSFVEFMAEFPRLKYDFKALMDAHYGFDIYHSKRAKEQFLQPDLLAFS